MKSTITLTLALLAGSLQASTLGFLSSTEGYAYWDTFSSSTTYPTVTISDAAADGADTTDFTASLSALMPGSTPGGGERIYSGTGATANAFNLTIDGIANTSFDSLTLQLKFTGPLQNVPVEDNIGPAGLHFDVAGETSWGAYEQSYLGYSTEGSNTFYIYAWTWTDLVIDPSDEFTISIGSDTGHVSLDAIRLDAAVVSAVPEPSAAAALAGLGALGCATLRRRRHA